MKEAKALLARGDSAAAEALLRDAVKADPTDESSLLALAQIYTTQKRNAEAVAICESVADLHAQHARLPRAIELYQRIVTLDPSRGETEEKLASVLQRAGRTADALAHLRQAARLYRLQRAQSDALVRVLEVITVLDPKDLDARLTLGGVFLTAGDLTRARPALEGARALDPDNLRVLRRLDDTYLALGEPALAAEIFERIRARLPPDPAPDEDPALKAALVAIGTLVKYGVGEKAEKKGLDLVESFPKSTRAWMALMSVRMQNREREKAVEAALQALDLAKGRPARARQILHEAFTAAGSHPKLIQAARRVVGIPTGAAPPQPPADKPPDDVSWDP